LVKFGKKRFHIISEILGKKNWKALGRNLSNDSEKKSKIFQEGFFIKFAKNFFFLKKFIFYEKGKT